MNERIPPQALNIERSVLGELLCSQASLDRALPLLTPECFYAHGNRVIYEAIVSVVSKQVPADLLTVAEEMRKKGHLRNSDEESYLNELVTEIAPSSNIETACQLLRDKADLRAVINAAYELQERAYASDAVVTEVVGLFQGRAFAIGQHSIAKPYYSPSELLQETFPRIEKIAKGEQVGLSTGLIDLDGSTGGLQRGDLVILAARPSMGKTAFACGLALNAALKHNKAVLFFSLEMRRDQIGLRAICREAGVSFHLVNSGKLPKRDYPKLSFAAGPISNSDFFVCDDSGLSPVDIVSRSRRFRNEVKRLDLVVVDYLQLMRHVERHNSKREEIGAIARDMKAVAKSLDIPVVLLSQLSREVEKRGKGARPQLSDLAESGEIEAHADVVLFLHRDKNDQESTTQSEILIGKQRNGPSGISIPVAFTQETMRFDNLVKQGEHDWGDAPRDFVK